MGASLLVTLRGMSREQASFHERPVDQQDGSNSADSDCIVWAQAWHDGEGHLAIKAPADSENLLRKPFAYAPLTFIV